MPINDQANDRYNPPGTLSVDFEEYDFGDLEVNELFWQTNRPKESNPWRKLSETQGMNLKTQTTHNFKLKTKVYQKI
jgi:hypothetical protein